MLLSAESGIGWDGKISFGVIDENIVRDAGLIDDIPRLIRLIESGDFSWKWKVKQPNKVTNYARQNIATILSGGSIILPSQMELGTGSGAPSANDQDLWSPTVNTLKTCAYSQTYLNYFAQFVTTWQTSDPIQGTWTEVGLKDSNNGLWAHAAIINLPAITSGEMLVCQWQVQILGN